MIRKGNTRVNGEKSVPGYLLKEKDVLTLRIEEHEWSGGKPATVLKKTIPGKAPALKIIFVDDCLLVLDKPAGICAHSRGHTGEHDLHGLAIRYLAGKNRLPRDFSPAFVHRLDRSTSGLIIMALTGPALRRLCEQFRKQPRARIRRQDRKGRRRQARGYPLPYKKLRRQAFSAGD
jgi:23S rRNA pseudouridine955/2504/2580 synthase